MGRVCLCAHRCVPSTLVASSEWSARRFRADRMELEWRMHLQSERLMMDRAQHCHCAEQIGFALLACKHSCKGVKCARSVWSSVSRVESHGASAEQSRVYLTGVSFYSL